MIYPDDQLKFMLEQLGMNKSQAEMIISIYNKQSEQYKNGFCKSIDDFSRKEKCSELILYGLVWLCDFSAEVTNYGITKTVCLFELLAGDFKDDERYIICEDILELLGLIKDPDNMQDVLRSMLIFGNRELISEDEKPTRKMFEVMVRQLKNLYAYIEKVSNDYKANGEDIESIKLTGSDGHFGSKQVLLIKKKNQGIVVLKPRCVEPEKGVGKVISAFNAYFSEQNIKIQLPNPWITDKGEMEYLIKKTEFTKEEAEDYYRQMGVLICIAELLGMTDLHQDNIMASTKGPVIIDAECILNPWTLYKGSFNSTCLNMAFSHWSGDGKDIAEAAFYITDGETKIESTSVFRQYMSQICAGIYAGLRAYTVLGGDLMITQQVTSPLTKIRWVPIATEMFYEAGHSFYESSEKQKQDDWWNPLITKLKTEISKMDLPQISIDIDEEKLKKAFINSYENKDIPYFTLKYDGDGTAIMKEAEIYCDYDKVGSMKGLSLEWVKEYEMKPWLELQLSYIPSKFWLEIFNFFSTKKQ